MKVFGNKNSMALEQDFDSKGGHGYHALFVFYSTGVKKEGCALH